MTISDKRYVKQWRKCLVHYGHEPTEMQWAKWLRDCHMPYVEAKHFYGTWPEEELH